MRNPINSMVYQNKNISFLLKAILEQIGELKTTPAMKKKIKKIKRKANEMMRSSSVMKQSSKLLLFFVQDLLDFAQIKQKKFTKHIEEFSIKEAMEELVMMLEFQSSSKGVYMTKVFKDFSPNHFMISTDKQRLQQTVLNLLSNALKFTNQGGYVHITASIRQSLQQSEDGDLAKQVSYIDVAIKDSGVGIKAED